MFRKYSDKRRRETQERAVNSPNFRKKTAPAVVIKPGKEIPMNAAEFIDRLDGQRFKSFLETAKKVTEILDEYMDAPADKKPIFGAKRKQIVTGFLERNENYIDEHIKSNDPNLLVYKKTVAAVQKKWNKISEGIEKRIQAKEAKKAIKPARQKKVIEPTEAEKKQDFYKKGSGNVNVTLFTAIFKKRNKQGGGNNNAR